MAESGRGSQIKPQSKEVVPYWCELGCRSGEAVCPVCVVYFLCLLYTLHVKIVCVHGEHGGEGGGLTSAFEITSMIMTSCQTQSVQPVILLTPYTPVLLRMLP